MVKMQNLHTQQLEIMQHLSVVRIYGIGLFLLCALMSYTFLLHTLLLCNLLLCANQMFLVHKLFMLQKSRNRSPLSFILAAAPCGPMRCSNPLLLLSRAAFMSLISNLISWLGISFITSCSCSQNASFSTLSAPYVCAYIWITVVFA